MTENVVAAAWRDILANELNNNLLMNSPKGKTAFACGVGFAVGRLLVNWDRAELTRLYQDLAAFTDAYMAAEQED